MDRHVTIAGWLNAALGIFSAGLGLFLLWEAWRGEGDGWMGEGILLGYFFGGVLALVGLAYVAVGAGLLKAKRWAKVLAVVLSALGFLWFPLGTAVAVYTIWAVTRGGSGASFK